MQIFRNLKPYWKSVIIIALLLVLQAYCDLSLPDYTSKLIDTGIQNYGIENCSPKQIPEKAYKVIDGFMDDDEKAVWEKYYKDGSEILIPQENGMNPRRLTPRECARLMGYPDEYIINKVSDVQAYRQCGNSVVVPLITAVSKQIVQTMLTE